jgi:hypothetical protein
LLRAHANLAMQEAWDCQLDALPWDVNMLIEEPEEEDNNDDEMIDLTPVVAQTPVAAPVVAAPTMVAPVAQAQALSRAPPEEWRWLPERRQLRRAAQEPD